MSRGTAYPYIGLEEAVDLARKIYNFSKRSAASLEAVVRDEWKYSPTSSSAQKVVAALRYFGLAETQGGGKGTQGQRETIKITDRAFRILVDSPDSSERKQAITDAFMGAKAYKLCWTTWGADMPPSMRSTLIFSHGFHESSVDAFLKDYKKSVEFAGLVSASEGDKRDLKRPEAPKVALGDFVQWEHDGVLGLPSPLKLVKFSEDGRYGWVEGHSTGLPVSELVKADPPVTPLVGSPPPPSPVVQQPSAQTSSHRAKLAEHAPLLPKGVGMRQEVFCLAEGDVTIQWPEALSQESLEDFSDWLRILERKVKRSVVNATPPAPPPQTQSPDSPSF